VATDVRFSSDQGQALSDYPGHGVMPLAGWRFRRSPRNHWSGPGGIDDLCERHQHLINTIISMSVTVSRTSIT
jgi:hypothetical protein